MEMSKEKPTVLVCIKSINILCWDESFHTVRYGTYINERMNEDRRRKGEKKKKGDINQQQHSHISFHCPD